MSAGERYFVQARATSAAAPAYKTLLLYRIVLHQVYHVFLILCMILLYTGHTNMSSKGIRLLNAIGIEDGPAVRRCSAHVFQAHHRVIGLNSAPIDVLAMNRIRVDIAWPT